MLFYNVFYRISGYVSTIFENKFFRLLSTFNVFRVNSLNLHSQAYNKQGAQPPYPRTF